MSASSIARWNSIPMSRADEASLKHPRPASEPDDDDDDVSIVSRTPSPAPDGMDVDNDPSKYDEYVSGPVREVITVETKIKPTNKGFAMLAKLGWVEGQPLGVSGDGRVDPIPLQIKRDLTGLGKINQDVRMVETTVAQRRGMDSERQQKETENQRRAREDLVARKSALQSEISTTLRAFYCALCDKQFKTVAQYDEHTNSYAHHHKARFKDMQANVRLKPKEEVDKRKEKERKREEKELRKIAAANGIRMAKPTLAVSLDAMTSSEVPMDVSVSLTTQGLQSQSVAKKSGWTSLASASPPTPPTVSSEIWTPTPPTSGTNPSNAPAFRTAGWTSLDTGSSHALPPPSPAPPVPPPPPPTGAPPLPQPLGAVAQAKGGWAAVSSSLPPPTPSVATPLPPSDPQPTRSSWQQFQKSATKRR